ncbi:hypothetical protein R1T08_29535 [Streptomyces sp. SBC-4]|nr:hypothetical protein [Streptomyces sp. SBC-4]MDV5148200.1 hypothetical protein [Streptomyces sp. SBC-4]
MEFRQRADVGTSTAGRGAARGDVNGYGWGRPGILAVEEDRETGCDRQDTAPPGEGRARTRARIVVAAPAGSTAAARPLRTLADDR